MLRMENEFGMPSPSARESANHDLLGQDPVSEDPVSEAWGRIRGRLREDVGEVEYRSWLRQMTLSAIEGEEVVILLPTRFLRDWVRTHYGDRLRLLWQAFHGL